MDFQRRFDPQEENLFYADRRAMRPPVPGTIAVGQLREDTHTYQGKLGAKYADTLPMPLSKALLQRGQQRFGIYCVPCHGPAGERKSVLMKRNIRLQPTSYSDERLRQQPVGYFVHVISHGVRNMPTFASQIPVHDRWAIAAYVRALQLAGSATLEQVPADVAASKGWRASP